MLLMSAELSLPASMPMPPVLLLMAFWIFVGLLAPLLILLVDGGMPWQAWQLVA